MDALIIVLLIFMVILIVAIITFGFLFVFKKRSVLKVIMPDRNLSSKAYFRPLKKTEKVGDGIYNIDDKCEVKTFWGVNYYYYYGNPNPIIFDFQANNNNIVGTKAQDLKSFHESDLINKLFTTQNIDNLLLIAIVIVGALVLVQIILSFTGGTPQVTLLPNANNTQIISDAVKIAIRGG